MEKINRRTFVKESLAMSAGVALGLSLEEKTLLAQAEAPKSGGVEKSGEAKVMEKIAPGASLPMGKIGDLELSRLILGGNLIGGYAHSRDLTYVSDLLKKYFTDDKILETLQIAEENGINAVNTIPTASGIMKRYWKERGGKIKWIVQIWPNESDQYASVQQSIDEGASAVYVMGAVSDQFVKDKQADKIGKAVAHLKTTGGVPVGVGCHSLEVVKICEKEGYDPDFYVKTLHTQDYFSAKPDKQTDEVIDDPHNTDHCDNYFCREPEKVIEFMKTVKKPWMAFKVMAAGAIKPRPAFQHAFDSGADFVLAGIFDFQIAEDAIITREVLAKLNRARPWLA